jgi:hypothetical protein
MERRKTEKMRVKTSESEKLENLKLTADFSSSISEDQIIVS